ncbi:MAG TPA: dihydropteroate synthase [Terriglobales bacterium]|nr:dihydropteroate synthase [Terriglobales bacterium]
MHRPIRHWQVGSRRLALGERTWLMAILNLTPDSFYPASRLSGEAAAVAAAEAAVAAGADILDLGAESTRPGAAPLAAEAEWQRLRAPLAAIRRHLPDTLISVDTRHAVTARAALEAGADIINDVTGLEDPAMAALVAAAGCGAVLMHRRGEFAAMHRLPPLADPVGVVREGLAGMLERSRAAGIGDEQIVLDPGFGFGKNLDENFPILAHLGDWQAFGRPLLAGVSRKSFLGHALGDAPAEARLFATVAAVTAAILGGAHLARVHDVAPCRDAARIADAVLAAAEPARPRPD